MSAQHPSLLQLDSSALGEQCDDSVREHLTSCETCCAHVADVRRAGMTPGWVREIDKKAHAPRRHWLWAGSLASAIAAAAIVLLFLRSPGPPSADFTTVKGSAAAAIHIKSGNRVELWDGQSKLRPTDALRIEVVPDGHRYVGIFSEQHEGGSTEVIQLYSAALPDDGKPTILPKAWQVDSQPGPEIIIIVMSSFPVSADQLREDSELLGKGAWVQRFTFQKDLSETDRL